ncbi:MAG: hypothetical protein P8Z80_07375 [Pseudolabrys sp.]
MDNVTPVSSITVQERRSAEGLNNQIERPQIAAELATAEAKLAEEEAASEALIAAEPPH